MGRYRFKNSLIKWLCKFSGEDYQLIYNAKTDKNVKLRFAFIGVFVLLIFVISAYSSAHFIYELFDKNLHLAIPIGLIWGLTVLNIYLFLLYTITPPNLKGGNRSIKGVQNIRTSDSRSIRFFSIGFRIGFVGLLAIIIAQPWLITTFSYQVQDSLNNHKQKYRNNFIIQADSILIEKEMLIMKEMTDYPVRFGNTADSFIIEQAGQQLLYKIREDKYFLDQATAMRSNIITLEKQWGPRKQKAIDSLQAQLTSLVEGELSTDSLFLARTTPPTHINDRIFSLLSNCHSKLLDVVKDKNQQYERLNVILSASNFYIRRIQLINSEFPYSILAWIMTGMVVAMFIFPIYLKYRLRKNSNFYEVKKVLEERMVKEEYAIFRGTYSRVFSEKYNLKVDFYESCTNPPFNTIKKNAQELQSKDQNTLLKEVYKDREEGEGHKHFVSEYISK